MDDSAPHGDPESVLLWRSLRDYLKLDVKVEVETDSPEPNSPVEVTITVTNTAPTDIDWPDIVFEGVNLRVNGRSKNISSQFPRGRSLTFQHRCKYRELPELDISVNGNVSYRRFFQIHRKAQIPAASTKPTV